MSNNNRVSFIRNTDTSMDGNAMRNTIARVSGRNLGSGVGLYTNTSGASESVLNFRSVVGGDGISILGDTEHIVIMAPELTSLLDLSLLEGVLPVRHGGLGATTHARHLILGNGVDPVKPLLPSVGLLSWVDGYKWQQPARSKSVEVITDGSVLGVSRTSYADTVTYELTVDPTAIGIHEVTGTLSIEKGGLGTAPLGLPNQAVYVQDQRIIFKDLPVYKMKAATGEVLGGIRVDGHGLRLDENHVLDVAISAETGNTMVLTSAGLKSVSKPTLFEDSSTVAITRQSNKNTASVKASKSLDNIFSVRGNGVMVTNPQPSFSFTDGLEIDHGVVSIPVSTSPNNKVKVVEGGLEVTFEKPSDLTLFGSETVRVAHSSPTNLSAYRIGLQFSKESGNLLKTKSDGLYVENREEAAVAPVAMFSVMNASLVKNSDECFDAVVKHIDDMIDVDSGNVFSHEVRADGVHTITLSGYSKPSIGKVIKLFINNPNGFDYEMTFGGDVEIASNSMNKLRGTPEVVFVEMVFDGSRWLCTKVAA